MANIYKIPKLISAKTFKKLNGNTVQFKKLKNKAKIGANKKITLFALLGIIVSLINNFSPSAKGCKTPKRPTTLGPLLLCIFAIIFLYNKVKNATAINTGTIIIRLLKITLNI